MQNLATQHRPRRFADIVGQESAIETLRSAIVGEVIPQQILIAGPSGLGKTTLARAFAAALDCEEPIGGDSCGRCATCVAIADGRHPDVIEIDAASYGGKDEIKEIGQQSALAPLRADWRVYIIDEAHGISGPGIQAFLKILEEPPSHVVFILATTAPEKLGATLRGRCLLCEVRRPSVGALAKNLLRIAENEGYAIDEDAAREIALSSDPALGVRGTVMTLEGLRGYLAGRQDVTAAEIAERLGVRGGAFDDLFTYLGARDRAGALLALENVIAAHSDEDIRGHLSRWAKSRLLEAARSGVDLDRAVYDYDLCISTPHGDLWLELLVARLAGGSVSTAVSELKELLVEAREVGDALRSTIRTVEVGLDGTVVDQPAMSEVLGAGDVHVVADEATAVASAEAGGAEPIFAASDDGEIESTRLVELDAVELELINAVARSDVKLALRLRRQGLSSSGATIELPLLDDSTLAAELQLIASRHGAAITFRDQ